MSLRLHAPVVLPCDPSCSVLRDAVVDVVDGRITYVGSWPPRPLSPVRSARCPAS